MNTMFGYIPPNNVIQLSQTL
ncbi:hypothetical protein JDM1_2427 [Lactiplantibacillus plantarum JDM1]|nr:hypothetical protein JDM1_2427 [Lactiplantibacillus plantarum JDM1]